MNGRWMIFHRAFKPSRFMNKLLRSSSAASGSNGSVGGSSSVIALFVARTEAAFVKRQCGIQ